MKLNHLHHKHGGKITAITKVGHRLSNGVEEWFYIGDVDWSDGSKSPGATIYPWALSQDSPESVAEINQVSELMMDYLRSRGTWLEKPRRVGHYFSHWQARSPRGSMAI